jgi:hypothetical protein
MLRTQIYQTERRGLGLTGEDVEQEIQAVRQHQER